MAQVTILKKNWFQNQVEQFEKSRFGMMAILLTLQSCLGGIAAMYSLINTNYVFLGICAFASMLSNAYFIAQASSVWCLRLFYASAFVNIALIILNILTH